MNLRALGLALFVVAAQASAQYNITMPSITTCSGILEDSGGASGNYGNNESFTTTVCPDIEGNSIALNFILFQLSQTGGSTMDMLTIHDGEDTNAPLIGSFTGQLLQGLLISAGSQNASGCLTLTFTSNGSGTGNFAISLSCSAPCPAPIATIDPSLADTIRLCQGEELLLDASPSIAAPGRTITEYAWLAVGHPGVSGPGPDTSLAFALPGGYYMYLQVQDDLGCTSEPTGPITILVGTTPEFETTTPAVVCVPDQITLNGAATSTLLPLPNAACFDPSEPAFLPDNVGVPLSFTVPIATGQTSDVITAPEQLGDICLNIKHEFMGDLLIELECPNGQSVTLHQQGGGSTHLGDPSGPIVGWDPFDGACWEYCFNANPDHGTWVECAVGGTTPNVIQAPSGLGLAPGSYTSVEPLDSLVGCPVNGNWNLIITDLWASDDGFLCSWCTSFEMDQDSSFLALSPQLSISNPDSAYWSGVGVSNTGSLSTAQCESAGTYDFQYTVLDSYGCSFTSTVQVTGLDPLNVDAGSDILLCADSVQLALAVPNLVTFECTYSLVLIDSFGDSWNGGALLNVILGDDTTVHTLGNGLLSDSISFVVHSNAMILLDYVAGTVFNVENRFALYDADGVLLFDSGFGPASGILFSGTVLCGDLTTAVQWFPAQGLSNPTVFNPWLFTTTSGWYTATVVPASLPACAGTDSVWVETGATAMDLLWNDIDSTLCASADTLASYDWWLNGSLQTTTSTSCLNDPLDGTWHVIGTGASECPYVSDAVVLCPAITLSQDVGFVIALGADGTWAWTLNGSPIDGSGPYVPLQGNGMYSATVVTETCTITGLLEVSGWTNIKEFGTGVGLMVYPIPNQGAFTIQTNGLKGKYASLQCTDMAGRTVYQEQVLLNGSELAYQLELDLSAGTYLLLMLDDSGQRVARVVVK